MEEGIAYKRSSVIVCRGCKCDLETTKSRWTKVRMLEEGVQKKLKEKRGGKKEKKKKRLLLQGIEP